MTSRFDMTFQFARVETLYQGRSRLMVADVRLPDGQILRRAIEDHGPAVAVLPFDSARRTAILVRQFRAPVFLAAGTDATLEAIAGIVESDEEPIVCARREAFEEAGLRLETLEHVGTAWTMPGVSTELMHFYLAAYAQADRAAAGGGLPEELERITVVEMPLAELAGLADSARLDDMKALMLVQTLRLRRPDLFA
jgi:nudix-type nucleoside diphosphatase (YffH/AdpP family)